MVVGAPANREIHVRLGEVAQQYSMTPTYGAVEY